MSANTPLSPRPHSPVSWDQDADHIRLAAVIESAALAIISTDPDWNVRSWNTAAETLFGYRAEEMIGRSVLEFVPQEQRNDVLVLAERVRAGEVVAPFAALWLHKDGALVQVAVTIWPVRVADEFLGLGITYSDRAGQGRADAETRRTHSDLERQVSERTRELTTVSEGRHASEERFRLLVEGVRDYAIVMLDPKGRVTSWNVGAERITGYTADEVTGRHLGMFYLPGGANAAWIENAPEDTRFEHEGWRVRKDGSRFWANSVITPIRDADGVVLGFSSVTRDLTERKRAEESLRQRTGELEVANRELGQRNTENEMFVYSVSHDLRSPLVNLQGFSRELEKACRGLSELLAEEDVPPAVQERGRAILDGRVTKSVGFIHSAVTRLSNIIDALLRLSRAGRVEYRWEAVDMAQIAAQVVKAAQGTITERGATVTVGPLPPAWGDRTALEQVLGNLVGNALVYLDPARPGVIEIGGLSCGDGMRTYFVRDNGLGIDPGHQQKIFHAFQRAHPGVGSGEGLGLAIVARAIERHRGRVWVESRAGAGSTFFFTLPVPTNGH